MMRSTSTTVFACKSKACAPPPVGSGGSTPGVSVADIKKLIPKLLRTDVPAAFDLFEDIGFGRDMSDDALAADYSVSVADIKRLRKKRTFELGDFQLGALSTGWCTHASDVVVLALRKMGIREDVYGRAVPEVANGMGSHIVTQIGPMDSPNAIIIDFTLRQFDVNSPFPFVGTVTEYYRAYAHGSPVPKARVDMFIHYDADLRK